MVTLSPEDIQLIRTGFTITGAADFPMLKWLVGGTIAIIVALWALIVVLLRLFLSQHTQGIKAEIADKHINVTEKLEHYHSDDEKWRIKKDEQCKSCHTGLIGNDDKLKIEIMEDVQKCEEVLIRGQDNLRDSLLLKFEDHVKWKLGIDRKYDKVIADRLTIDSVKALIAESKQ